MSGESDQDRQHAPSQRRLEDARKQGDIARAPDLVTAAAFSGLLAVVLLLGPHIVTSFGNTGMMLLGKADRLSPQITDGGRLPSGLIWGLCATLAPLFLAPAFAALLALFVQQAVVLSPEKLQPKLSRISPLANAKQKFGREGLIGFARSVAKMAAIGMILWLYLKHQADAVLTAASLSPGQSSALLAQMLTGFLILICAVALLFGAADQLWQKFEHLRRNRMTHDEVKREHKESEGDPHMRALRRQRAHDIATNRMLSDVADADVVIVNPSHYAVALKWSRARRSAPVCVAKGVDEIAARIRERASLAGVPLHSDPPTARALYATLNIGAQIRPEHYLAIAAAIRFADRVRKRKKGILG